MKLTAEERISLVHNRTNRAWETWTETKGIILMDIGMQLLIACIMLVII